MNHFYKSERNVSRLLSVLTVILSSIVIFTGCHQNEQPPAIQTDENPTILNEDVLPKGKRVIEDEVSLQPITPNKTVALGSNETDTHPSGTVEIKGESRLDFLKKNYKNLLVFHAADTMEVRKPKLATLILGKNESIDKVRFEVLEAEDAEKGRLLADTNIDMGSKMRARLISFGSSKTDNSFEIEPLGDDEQTFKKGRDRILWQWKITPLKPGEQTLKLAVQVIEKDGEAVSLPARNIPVVIFAKPEKFFSKVGNFISNKYEWIITAICLPILLAWFTTKIKNKPAANKT